jgi:hypothetical protein
MTDPASNDRLETGVPAGDAAGDGGDLGASTEDVPLTREDAVARDAALPDEQPARPGSDPSLAQRAEPDAREVEP